MTYWGEEAAGAILFDPETRRFGVGLRSSEVNEPGKIGTFGGAVEQGMSVKESLELELQEELGYVMPMNLTPLSPFKDSDCGFVYHNFIATVDVKTNPLTLNWENDEVLWYSFRDLVFEEKEKLHFGLRSLLEDQESVQSMMTAVRSAKNIKKAGVELS